MKFSQVRSTIPSIDQRDKSRSVNLMFDQKIFTHPLIMHFRLISAHCIFFTGLLFSCRVTFNDDPVSYVIIHNELRTIRLYVLL